MERLKPLRVVTAGMAEAGPFRENSEPSRKMDEFKRKTKSRSWVWNYFKQRQLESKCDLCNKVSFLLFKTVRAISLRSECNPRSL